MIAEHLQGVADSPSCGEKVNGQSLGRGASCAGVRASFQLPDAFLTEGATAHQEHEGLVVSTDEHGPLEVQEPFVDLTGPPPALFTIADGLDEVEYRCLCVLTQKALALCHGRIIRRASYVLTVLIASVHALHANPLGHRDILCRKPAEVIEAVLAEDGL